MRQPLIRLPRQVKASLVSFFSPGLFVVLLARFTVHCMQIFAGPFENDQNVYVKRSTGHLLELYFKKITFKTFP